MISDKNYERPKLDKGQKNSLSIILEQIPQGSKVLDVGAATGRLGEYLGEHSTCIVDGIEANPDSAKIAQPFYRRLYCFDIEDEASMASIEEIYDVIVIADVLEHLKSPNNAMNRLRERLDPQGYVLISLPNIAHISIAMQLLQGRFEYRDDGLLDKTHLHFFTIESALQLLRDSGLRSITLLDRVIVGTQGTEFSSLLQEGINFRLLEALENMPEGNTYQFILKGSLQEPEAMPSQPRLTTPSIHGVYINPTIFYSHEPDLSSPSSLSMHTGLHERRFDLSFPLPAGVRALRLDPCDIAGIVQLYTLELRDENNITLWRFQASASITEKSQSLSIYWNEMPDDASYAILYCADNDPWLKLPVDPELLMQARTLRVDMHWPHSDDFTIIENFLVPFTESLKRDADESHARIKMLEQYLHTLQTELTSNNNQMAALHNELDHMYRLQKSPRYMLKATLSALMDKTRSTRS